MAKAPGKHQGCRCVRCVDTAGRTQYIGYSRNILLALKAHLVVNGTETCAFVKVQTFKYPKRDAMEEVRHAWLSNLNSLPPGNAEPSQWASTVGEAARATMLAEERNAYEEKKLKLRKAMADTTLFNELQRDAGSPQTSLLGVENGDWSSTIEEQNQETSS